MVRDQAVAQDSQIGLEGVWAGIGFGCNGRAAGGLCAAPRLIGGGQTRIDPGQGAAIGLVRPVRRRVLGGVGQGRQLGRNLGQLGRQAEFGAQGVDLLQIEAQHRPRLGAEGGAQHRAVHVRIAVPVAPDPGAHPQEGLKLGRVQQTTPGRQLFRRDPQEDAVQEGDDGVDLVLHHQTLGAHQAGGPQDDDLAAQGFVDLGRRTGVAGLVAGIQQIGDGGDPVDDALAPHLGRVGGQDRRDQGLVQQGAHRRLVDLLIGQPQQGALGRVGTRAGLGLVLGASAGGPVLGDVGEQGKEGETVRQTRRLIHAHGGQQLLQPLRRMGGGVAVIGDGGLAHGLDVFEQGLSAFGENDLAQKPAQQSDFFAQGVVGGRAHHRRISSVGVGRSPSEGPQTRPSTHDP